MNNNERVGEIMQEDKVFIPIPNGVIEATIHINSWILPVYTYLSLNKNIIGQVKTSIKEIQDEFYTPKNRLAEKENKENILKAILLLTSNLSNKDRTNLITSFLDITQEENFSEEEIELTDDEKLNQEKILQFYNSFELFEDYLKNFFKINMKYDCFREKNFTKCTLKEYFLFTDYFKNVMGKSKSNKTTGSQLMASYFLIKSIISKKQKFKETTFANSPSKLAFTKKRFMEYTGFTAIKTESILTELEKYNLITRYKNIINLPESEITE